jgi:hypothetical protein
MVKIKSLWVMIFDKKTAFQYLFRRISTLVRDVFKPNLARS